VSLLADLLAGLIKPVTGLIDELTTSEEEKLRAKATLLAIQADLAAKLAEYERDVVREASATIRAEAQSASWLARNWRPLTMLLFAYVIAHNYVLVPIFSLPSTLIVPDMWELLKIGMGGYVIGRSLEKVVPATVAALKAREQ